MQKQFYIMITKSSPAVLKIIKTGEAIEKKGRVFYLKNAKTAENAGVKQLIEFLAKQELLHLHYLENLESDEKQGLGDVKYKILVKKYRKVKKPQIFKGKIRKDAGDVEVIITAMGMEKKSIDLYKKGAKISKTENEKLFFQRLVEFEEEHYAWLKDMLDNLTYAKIES
jgi:rubrerythrin